MDRKNMDNFEHTRPMGRVSPEKERATKAKNVRELDPVDVQGQQGSYDTGNNQGKISGVQNQYAGQGHSGQNTYRPYQKMESQENSGRGKMIVLGVAGFVVAAFFGAVLSGYMSEQQTQKDALDNQQQQAARQLQDADSQQRDLEQQKSDLEAKYQELLAQQKKAQSAADRLQGQQEQQNQTSQDKSAAGKVLDKITGEAGKEKQQAAQTASQVAEARQKLQDINAAVETAGAAIDEVNTQLDNLENIRQQAQSVKENVDRTYAENKDLVDNIVHYAALGLDGLKKLLAN